jgi:beta-glucanase (GH16 family)
MTVLLFALQAATLGATNYAVDAAMPAPAGKPSVADEFNTLDLSKWRFDIDRNPMGWPNNEKQYYAHDDRRENARIEKGALVIEARKESLDKKRFADWGGQGYTSARLISKPAMGYGFYEVRAKLPCGRGSGPPSGCCPMAGSGPTRVKSTSWKWSAGMRT